MRITTRTPPIRIAAADMVALAALPAEHAGLLLRWGMELYGAGRRLTVDEAMADARLDVRGMSVLLDGVRALLDGPELTRGLVVVRCFADAAAARDRISVSRVRAAPEQRSLPLAVGSDALPPGRAVAPGAPSRRRPRPDAGGGVDIGGPPAAQAPEGTPERPAAGGGRIADPPAERDAIAAALVARGADAADAVAATSRWIANHGLRETFDAVAGMAGRKIAKPIAYIDRVLENSRSERTADLPSAVLMANRGGALPRPVRKRIHVGPRASWEFLGWTARGHHKDGGTRETRREVWRTDAGTLAYEDAGPNRTIPDYAEDPGVYDNE